MNKELVKNFETMIERVVVGLEKKRGLDNQLSQLMQRPVHPCTTPEKAFEKEYNGIMAQLQGLTTGVLMQVVNSTRDAVCRTVHSKLYPQGAKLTLPGVKMDIWILENGLIYTVKELAHMKAKYEIEANPAILRFIERYAKEHFPKSAKEFAVEVEDADMYILAIETLVKMSQDAFADPNGHEAVTLENFVNRETGKADGEGFIKWVNNEKAA